MLKKIFTVVLVLVSVIGRSQTTRLFADSLRQVYHVPALAYAVISSDKINEMEVMGIKKNGSGLPATLNDRFRIGSNTKAITGFLAALLVKEKKISWNTKFFNLFPELKSKSNKAYHSLTLLDLLSFRARLYPYTYTYSEPVKEQFTGSETDQRYQFAGWFFQQNPVSKKGIIHFSNLSYVAAGLMLEKASGKPYQALVESLGKTLNIDFGFGAPNRLDTLQTWGHNSQLVPEAPADDYKLSWLLAAGNINTTLPGYAAFIQMQLQGLSGSSALLSKEEFSFLHFGHERFAVGWFWAEDEKLGPYSYNIGNPGSFLSKVLVFKNLDKAFVIFSNAQTKEADVCIDLLLEELKRKYGAQQ